VTRLYEPGRVRFSMVREFIVYTILLEGVKSDMASTYARVPTVEHRLTMRLDCLFRNYESRYNISRYATCLRDYNLVKSFYLGSEALGALRNIQDL
jgi:hypothetical protein